jgi:TonB family protein
VSFEQFNTQVLLLHSEQSTLDKLRSGFNDRYTVHCATSGSEALNTLGETQIDVIVSAEELPGMSGVEALREAKKRSPETIGILLAGSDSDQTEALVGDQEVFQIVRGSVTADSLKSMIDSATQKARLIALAESANDTTASPDVEAEHIVMETSENGSSVISGNTGRMPALDPASFSGGADVGARSVDVLVLTHDEEFLGTVKESARGLHNVIFANTVSQADEAIRKHKIGVAVVDAAMVGANVEKMTLHLRSQSARLVAIVAGRRDDGEMLMDLINRGRVYRFLLKPVSPGRARLAIEASVKHHLEAPDSAFKVAGQPAPQPVAEPKPAPKKEKPKKSSAPAPQSKPAKPAVAKAAAKPVQTPQPAQPTQPASEPAAIFPDRDEALSPVEEGLGNAFGGDDSSFTETMTGIVATVTKPFKSKDKDDDLPPAREPAGSSAMGIDHPAMGSGGSLFGSPKMLAIGAAALVIVGVAGFWLFGGSGESGPGTTQGESASTADSRAPQGSRQPEAVAPAGIGIDALIDEARRAADAGQVYAPAGNNAIELYLAALDVAPTDPVARIGLEEMIEETLGLAETALLESRFDDARAAIRGIELGDPRNSRLPFLQSQLEQMASRDQQDRQDQDDRVAAERAAADQAAADQAAANQAAAERAAAERSAEEQVVDNELEAQQFAATQAAAERAAAERAAAERRTAELASAQRNGSGRAASSSPQETVARDQEQEPQPEVVTRPEPVVREPVVEQSPPETAVASNSATTSSSSTVVEPPAASAQSVEDSAPVAVSSLRRSKYVAPKYPRAAQRRGLSGWVDVIFTVDIDGSVSDVEVRDSDPGDTFVNSAINAVEKWEFEPVIENGVAIQKRAAVRMMFAIE